MSERCWANKNLIEYIRRIQFENVVFDPDSHFSVYVFLKLSDTRNQFKMALEHLECEFGFDNLLLAISCHFSLDYYLTKQKVEGYIHKQEMFEIVKDKFQEIVSISRRSYEEKLKSGFFDDTFSDVIGESMERTINELMSKPGFKHVSMGTFEENIIRKVRELLVKKILSQ